MRKCFLNIKNIPPVRRIRKEICPTEQKEQIIKSKDRAWDVQLQNSKSKGTVDPIRTNQGFRNIEYFVDDGYSGANFQRPDWQRMIELIEADKVSVLLVKDLSSAGRNYSEVGISYNYTEILPAPLLNDLRNGSAA